jgi:hypothetical protein
MGPKPGMLISPRAVSSFSASFAMLRSSRAIASSRLRSCTTSGASASHASNGIVSSQASINSASSRANRSPAERSRRPRSSVRARDQHLPRLVTHQRRLVHERAHADKPHRRSGHRFTGARILAMHHFERPDAAARRGPERTRGPGELEDGRRDWKNRFEHQYIVNVRVAARKRRGRGRIGSDRTRQNVHSQV